MTVSPRGQDSALEDAGLEGVHLGLAQTPGSQRCPTGSKMVRTSLLAHLGPAIHEAGLDASAEMRVLKRAISGKPSVSSKAERSLDVGLNANLRRWISKMILLIEANVAPSHGA